MSWAVSFWQQYAVSGYKFLEDIVTGDKTCLLPYPRDKTCKYGVETFWVPTIKEVEGCEVCWHSDGHRVIGPISCVFSRLHGTRSNSQCRCILYCAGSVKGCHKTKIHSAFCLRVIMLSHSANMALVGNLGMSNIWSWSGTNNYHLFPAVKDHLGSHRFQSDDDIKDVV